MAKKNNITIKKWLLQNFFAIAAIIVAFANVWIATKLAPIAQDIGIIKSQVLANENNISDLGKDNLEIKKEVRDELKQIRESVTDINRYLRK